MKLRGSFPQNDWTLKSSLLIAALFISGGAAAQSAAPKEATSTVVSKPLVQLKPKAPAGCKFVGTVKGSKLWAGDCTASELSSAAPAAETTQPLTERAAGAIPPGQK